MSNYPTEKQSWTKVRTILRGLTVCIRIITNQRPSSHPPIFRMVNLQRQVEMLYLC